MYFCRVKTCNKKIIINKMRTHIKKEVSSIAHHPAGSVEETRFEKIDNVIFSNSVTDSVSVSN